MILNDNYYFINAAFEEGGWESLKKKTLNPKKL